MSADRLALRHLAQHTNFSFQELRDNRTREGAQLMAGGWDEVNAAHLAGFELSRRIYVEHQIFDLAEIVSRLRYLAARYGVKAAIIDYGQLIGAQVRKGGTQTEEQSIIARALKNEVATALNMPVWCLVQPNKDQTRRGDSSLLKVTDIAGASEWRAVANQIWLLNRDPSQDAAAPGKDETRMPVLLEIAKSRDGGRATIPLTLLGERFLFVERDTHHGEPEARPLNGLRQRRREWSGERDDSE
jgi:replicative DNA helicase